MSALRWLIKKETCRRLEVCLNYEVTQIFDVFVFSSYQIKKFLKQFLICASQWTPPATPPACSTVGRIALTEHTTANDVILTWSTYWAILCDIVTNNTECEVVAGLS